MEAILATLVGMRTITGDRSSIASALDFIENYLAKRGMYLQRFDFAGVESVLATTRPTNTPAVLLNAHVDVVAGNDEQFALRQDDKNYYGRGVYDLKHAIAAYLQLVDDLQGQLDQYDFGIMINSDEETGGTHGAKRLVETGYLPTKVCIVPDAGDNWALQTHAKGVWHIRITTAGKHAHGSRPWEGKNALMKLHSLVDTIHQLFPPVDQLATTSTVSIGKIVGGTVVNQIPNHAFAELDIRTGSIEQHHHYKKMIQALCKHHSATLETLADSLPYSVDRTNPLITQFVECVESVIGRPMSDSHSFGTTDARYFAYAGVPCIATAPPVGDPHGPNEWLSKEGLEHLRIILRHYLDKVAKV